MESTYKKSIKMQKCLKVFFYRQTLDSQWAPINPEEKKIVAELCSFPLMNVHYEKYRLTLTVPSAQAVFYDFYYLSQ